MMRKALLATLLMGWIIPAWAFAHVGMREVAEVRIVSDSGTEFAKHRTYPRVQPDGRFFYVEAVKGDRYSIRVTNKSGGRIGLVIAVDGRNIISGKRSELKRDERMYIIGPYEDNIFEGWRTSMDRTNRFYFTEVSDSYAEKVFSDASAMGTIAVAVYREKLPEVTPYSERQSPMRDAPAAAAPQGRRESSAAGKLEKKGEEAGTGFGETTYSLARVVHFDPEQGPAEKIVLKYEWRSELCKKGIIPCGPKNRLWPDDWDFAPIPKDFRN